MLTPCDTDDADTSSPTLEETSILSNATDEGLDMSQRLTESIFIGPDIDAEGEEIVSGTALICCPHPPYPFCSHTCLFHNDLFIGGRGDMCIENGLIHVPVHKV